MSRYFRWTAGAVFFLALALAWLVASTRTEEEKPRPEASSPPASKNPIVLLARRLQEPVKFSGFDDPKTTLAEALSQLTKVSGGISFEINEDAFKNEAINEVAKTEIAQSPIPEMNASMDRVLRKVLARVSVPSKAAYVVRKGYIEITTEQARLAEFWPNGNENAKPADPNGVDPGADAPKPRPLPLVIAEFDKRPLSEALKELADLANYSVILDVRAADKAHLPVSATLINVPLDTAVRMLADMAELKPVLLNNAIYVTTEARAERFQPGQPFPSIAPMPAGMAFLPGNGGGLMGMLGGFGGLGQTTGFQQPVRIQLRHRPLAEALKELVDGRPVRVILDSERLGDKAAATVTADLDRVSLQNAIRILADMVELAPVFLDNVAYVTTKEKAQRLQKELPGWFPDTAKAAAPKDEAKK